MRQPKITGLQRLITCTPIFKIGPWALARINPADRFLNLWKIEYENGDGKKHFWNFCSRKKKPTLSNPSSDAVIVVATVQTEKGPKLVITAEYRLPIGGVEYGFPAGLIDDTESPVDAAKRELAEETGLEIVRINHVSPPLISSAGMSDETITLVFAEAKGVLSTSGQEESEFIEPMLMGMDELADLCYRRGKYEGVMIAAKAWPVIYGHLAVMGFKA